MPNHCDRESRTIMIIKFKRKKNFTGFRERETNEDIVAIWICIVNVRPSLGVKKILIENLHEVWKNLREIFTIDFP